MVDCKGGKNLFGFAIARPPCVVFIVCIAAFAIGLFSLGFFIKTYGWFDTADAREEVCSLFFFPYPLIKIFVRFQRKSGLPHNCFLTRMSRQELNGEGRVMVNTIFQYLS